MRKILTNLCYIFLWVSVSASATVCVDNQTKTPLALYNYANPQQRSETADPGQTKCWDEPIKANITTMSEEKHSLCTNAVKNVTSQKKTCTVTSINPNQACNWK